MRVEVRPHPLGFPKRSSGIYQVVAALYRHLPKLGVETGEGGLVHCVGGETYDRVDVYTNQGTIRGPRKAAWEKGVSRDIAKSMNLARAVTVLSEWQRDRLAEEFGEGDYRVIPNGVEIAEWEPGECAGYALWAKVSTDAGLNRKMGFEVAKALAKKCPKVEFVFTCWDGTKPFENVKVIGPQPYDRIKPWVRQAGVYLATCPLEPFGIQTLEAMACGVPVVGLPSGGTPEIVRSGIDGLLRGEEGLPDALRLVLSRRHVYSGAARARAAQFDWPLIVPRYVEVYEELS